jgi:cell division protein FtsI/penicillin-binding protein 2
VARFIEENYDLLPGVKVVVTSKRQYLTKELFAEIIGYEGQITASAIRSAQGLGYSARTSSARQASRTTTSRISAARRRPDRCARQFGQADSGLVTTGKDPVPGDSLTLNIDTKSSGTRRRPLQWGRPWS